MIRTHLFPQKLCPWSSTNHRYIQYVSELQRQFGTKSIQEILFTVYTMLPPWVRFVIDDLVLVDMIPSGIPACAIRVSKDVQLGDTHLRLREENSVTPCRLSWDAYFARRADFLFIFLPTAIFFAAEQAMACRSSWVTPLNSRTGPVPYQLLYSANDTVAGFGSKAPHWAKNLWIAFLYNAAIWKGEDLAWFLSHFMDKGVENDYRRRWEVFKKQPAMCVHCLEEITGNCTDCSACHGTCHSTHEGSGHACILAHRCPDMFASKTFRGKNKRKQSSRPKAEEPVE